MTTWSTTDKDSLVTLSNGDLTATGTGGVGAPQLCYATTSISTGTKKFGVTITADPVVASPDMIVGVSDANRTARFGLPGYVDNYGIIYRNDGVIFYGTANANPGNIISGLPSWTVGDFIEVEPNVTAGTTKFYKNGSLVATASYSLAQYFPLVGPFQNQQMTANFTSWDAPSTTDAVGSIAGSGSVSGAATAIKPSAAAISGVGAVSGVARAIKAAAGSISASGAVSGTAFSFKAAIGTLAGSSAVTGVTPSTTITPAVGTISGSAAAAGSGVTMRLVAGAVSGASTLGGAAVAITASTGSMSGSSALFGVRAPLIYAAVGTLTGHSQVSGVTVTITPRPTPSYRTVIDPFIPRVISDAYPRTW